MQTETVPASTSSPWGNVFRMLWSPSAVMAEVYQSQRYLPAIMVATVFGTICSIIQTHQHTDELLLANGMLRAQGSAPVAMIGTLYTLVVLYNAAAPWFATLGIATIFWAVASYSDVNVNFRSYFVMTAYARIPLVITPILQTIFLWNRPLRGDGFDLSLHVLFPDSSGFTSILLHSLDIPAMWEWFLLTVAFSVVANKSMRSSLLLPAVNWFLVILAGMLRLELLGR